MAATLGGLIRDIRIQKDISQLEVAFSLGWKEPSRLSRIEQGKVEKPPQELLEKIMNAMQLTPEERNRLYIAGNYIPTAKDIEQTLTKIKPLVDEWPYPAVAMDFSWRVLASNNQITQLYGFDSQAQKAIINNLPNLLEVIFAPGSAGYTEKEEDYIRMLAHFQYAQQSSTKERWYLDLIKKMMENENFRKLWLLAEQHTSEKLDIYNYTSKKIKDLSFYCFTMTIFKDPRYMIEFYSPADAHTAAYYGK